MTNGLKDMWDAIPADIGIPNDVMDRARVALAYAMTQASDGETEAAIAIIGKAIMAERERCTSERTLAVKQLEWRIFCSRSLNSEAKTPFGEYVIQSETDGWCLYLAGEEDAEAAYTTLEAAKAAAQADCERRVMSTLIRRGDA